MKIQKIYNFEEFEALLSDSRFSSSSLFLYQPEENVIGQRGDTLYIFETDELAQIVKEKLDKIKNENKNKMETDNK